MTGDGIILSFAMSVPSPSDYIPFDSDTVTAFYWTLTGNLLDGEHFNL